MPSDRPLPSGRRRSSTGRRRTTTTTRRRPLPSRPVRRGRRRGVARRGLPLFVRFGLGASVLALAAIALLTATGGLGPAIRTFGSSLGSSLGSAIDLVSATSTPLPSVAGDLGIPTIVAPAEPFTNQPTIEVTGQLPGVAVGRSGYRVRLYVTRGDAAPLSVAEIPAPLTAFFSIPGVPLAEGKNLFTATVVDTAGVEGQPSVPVGWILDTNPPRITVSAPEDASTVATPSVDVIGKTQGRSRITVRNAANGASVSGSAESADGTFRLTIPLDPGRNGLTVTVTDPAGNVATLELGVTRSAGAISADLRANAYRFKTTKLPRPLVLTVTVTDPAGTPVVDASVTFTVSLPGMPVITGDAVTDATGVASFSTTVPAGTAPGSGPATAFVTTSDFGTTSARTVITIE